MLIWTITHLSHGSSGSSPVYELKLLSKHLKERINIYTYILKRGNATSNSCILRYTRIAKANRWHEAKIQYC